MGGDRLNFLYCRVILVRNAEYGWKQICQNSDCYKHFMIHVTETTPHITKYPQQTIRQAN